MKNKKILKLIIVFSLILSIATSILTGCKKPTEVPFTDNRPEIVLKDDAGVDFSKQISNIVEDGASNYLIVYGAKAVNAQQYACSELQNFIQLITGVYIQVIADIGLEWDESQTYISLGNTVLLDQAGIDFDYTTLNGDGFFLKTKGNSLFINGFRDRGIIYGAYDFLEVMTGLRFVTWDYTFVPNLDRLPLYETDRVQIPAFEYRGVMTNATFEHVTEEDFTVRMRFNYQYAYISEDLGGKSGIYHNPDMNGVHNALWWVNPGDVNDPNSLSSQHPEFFVWHEDGSHVINICWSLGITEDGKIDPNVPYSPLTVAIEKAKHELLNAPSNIDTILMGIMDTPLDGSNVMCKCDKCLIETEKYTSTGIVIRFMNIVAEELLAFGEQELGRKINVSMLCYGATVKAPLINGKLADPTVKPHDNLIMQIAPYFGDFYLPYNHENQEPDLKYLFSEWSSIHNKFHLWAYTLANNSVLNNGLFYFDNTYMWSEQLNYLNDIGIKSIFFQDIYVDKHIFQPNLFSYVASKMMWNPNLDVNAIRQEYFRLYYGPAAPYVAEVVNRFDVHIAYETAYNGLIFSQDAALQSVRLEARFWPYSFLTGLAEHLDKGLQVINQSELNIYEKEQLIHRVKEFQVTPLYMSLLVYEENFPGDIIGKKLHAQKVFDQAEEVGIRAVSEYITLETIRRHFGV